ncbi:DUF397 domain-containing protein [Streptomonospora arabica]|uniref:DUF397 domain-containing protein n=1 Tax=Streptomonospora arabica TaxID=412417 RepID=A0ABV9SKD2_9ACTN
MRCDRPHDAPEHHPGNPEFPAATSADGYSPAGQAHLTWYVSTYTGGQGNCVQVADLPAGARAVRDSKHTGEGALDFPSAEWTAFLASARRHGM